MASVRHHAGKPPQGSPADTTISRSSHPRLPETPDDPATPDRCNQHAKKMRGNMLQEDLRPNRMGEAITARRWWSCLTFSWAKSFLSLGSTITIKEEHLEDTYKTHER